MKVKTSKLEELANREIKNSQNNEVNVYIGQHKKFRPKEEFVMCFTLSMQHAIKRAKENKTPLTAADYEVLFAYLSHMQYGNQISIAQQDIAEELGIQRPAVTRSISHLVDAGIFERKGRSLYASLEFFNKNPLWKSRPHADE